MRGKAQHVARPAQTHLQNVVVIGPKFTNFYPTYIRIGVIGGINARINVASAQNEGGVCQFSPIRALNNRLSCVLLMLLSI